MRIRTRECVDGGFGTGTPGCAAGGGPGGHGEGADPDGGGGAGGPGVSSYSVTQYSAAGCEAIDPLSALGAVGDCCVHDAIVAAASAMATSGAINLGDFNDISLLLLRATRPFRPQPLSQKVNHAESAFSAFSHLYRLPATGSCGKVRGGFGKPAHLTAELRAVLPHDNVEGVEPDPGALRALVARARGFDG